MATNDIKYTLNAQLADNSVTTQYSTNGKTLLKTPRSVSQTIYLGEAPAGGGDDGGSTEGGGGLDENPLGRPETFVSTADTRVYKHLIQGCMVRAYIPVCI